MNRFRFSILLIVSLLLTSVAWGQSNAPTGLTVNVTYGGSICLQWKPNITAATVYEIERSNDGRTGWNKVGESAATVGGTGAVGNYCDQNLPSLTKYYYQIRGKTGTTFTLYSNTANGTTTAAPPTPAAPTLSEITASTIRATWNTQFATTYELDMQTSGGAWLGINTQASGRNASLTFKISTLNGGTNYCFRVRAKDPQEGTSGYSPSACQTTPLLPTSIKNFAANAGGSTNSIKLTWTGYGKESGITIERRTGQTGAWNKLKDWLADGGEYTDTGLPSGTEYCYRIQESGHDVSETKCATTANLVVAPPTSLNVTPASASRMDLSWTASTSTFGSGYLVEAKQPGGSYSQIADLNGISTTTFSHNGLNASTQYCYRVRTKYTTPSDYTPEVCNTTQAPPVTTPAAPSGLGVTATSSTEIKLTWTDNSTNESGFEIEQGDSKTGTFTNIKTTGADVKEFIVSGLASSRNYCFQVRAVNTAGKSGYAGPECATTQAPPVVVPTPPTNLSATAVSATQINLTWTASTSTFGSGYVIEQASSQGGNFIPIAEVNGLATSAFSVTGLQPSTQYCYRLRTRYTTNSTPGNEACTTTQAPPLTPPRAPSGLIVVATSSTEIKLTWTDNSTNESGFEIEQGDSQTGTFSKIQTTGIDATAFIVSGLQPSRPYCFQVRAINGAGKSAYAGPVCASTQAPPITQPAAPAAFVANAVSTSVVNLSWMDKSDNETGFELQWNLTGTDPWTSLPTQASNVTTFAHTGLTANTRYYYRLRAVNTAKQSDWVLANTGTPNLPVPTTSADLTAQLADYDRITLTWNPIGNGPTSIVVERSASPTSGFTSVTTLAGTATQFTDKDLPEKTTFYYRIRATNTYGSSDNSNVASATTPETIIAVRRQPLPEGIYAYVKDQTLLVILNWSYFQAATLRVVSLTGRDLLTDQCRSNGGTQFQYDVAHLPAGIYILCLDTTDNRYTKKIWIP